MNRRLQRDKRNGNYFVWIRRGGVSKYFRFGSNKKLAEKELEQIERDIENGRIAFVEQETTAVQTNGKKDIRIEELAVKHLEWIKENRAENTFLLRQHFVSLFAEHVGACMVSELTSKTIEEFYHWYRKRKARKESAPRKCGHAIREIRSLLRWGDQHELCRNPIRRWLQVPTTPPPTRHFSDDDLAKLLKAVPADFADLLVFGTLTGLRPQELRSLVRQNIIQDEHGRMFVHIEHHKTSESSKVPVPRTVPLSAEAVEIVQRQEAAHPKSGVIFLNDDGTPYSSVAFRQRLERWCRRAGVPVMPPYALRHVFGTRQASNGTNQAILAQLMGHSNLQTAARYVVNCDEAHIKAVDEMARRIMPIIQKAKNNLSKAS